MSNINQKRLVELLHNAARCFDQCYSPFCHEELSKMEVTADECKELSSWIGDIIKDYADLLSDASR